MLPFLAIIPGVFAVLEKIIGPVLSSTAGQSILGAVIGHLSSNSPTVNGLLTAIEGVMGKLEDTKRLELQNEFNLLMSQIEVDKVEESKDSKTFTPRTTLFWGLSLITLVHLVIAELANILCLIHGQPLAPMDNITIIFLGGMLGLYHVTKTIEKVNSNQDNSDT